MKPSDFIGEKAKYDRDGQILWGVTKKDGLQMLAEVRGWGAIQNLFVKPKSGGEIDMAAAGKFQDEVGEWLAAAVNEKLERERIADLPLREKINFILEEHVHEVMDELAREEISDKICSLVGCELINKTKERFEAWMDEHKIQWRDKIKSQPADPIDIGMLRDCWSVACSAGHIHFPSLSRMQTCFEDWMDSRGIKWRDKPVSNCEHKWEEMHGDGIEYFQCSKCHERS